MKFNTLLILILSFCAFHSCNKDLERPERDFPGLLTGTPRNITEDGLEVGLSIKGSIEGILEYGFVWNQDKNIAPRIWDLKLVMTGQPQQNNISEIIQTDLPIGPVLLSAFIRTDSKTIYGPAVSVNSLGGRAPTINQISPSNFAPGDTLTILGEGFASIISGNIVTIDDTEAKIIENESSIIKIIAPNIVNAQPIVNITSWGKKTTANVVLSSGNPFINSLSKSQSGMDQLITIHGGNFSTNNANNSVTFSSEFLSEESTTIFSSRDSIIVRVPNLSRRSNNISFDIIVQVGNNQSRIDNSFKFLNPTFSESQTLAYLCDTLTIKGDNFSPILENNSYITTSQGQPIKFLKGSSTELKFLNQGEFEYSTLPFAIPVKIFHNDLVEQVNIPIQPPTITSSNTSSISSSDEDIIIEINGTGFSQFINQYFPYVTIPNHSRITGLAEMISVNCNKIVFKIDKSKLGPEVTLHETWRAQIFNPSGEIEHDIMLQINGLRTPLNLANSLLFDRSRSGNSFVTADNGYYQNPYGNIYSYNPVSDNWRFVAPPLEGMDFVKVNNQVIEQIAIHTWSYQNEFKVAGLDLDNDTWIEYETPSNGILPPPGTYLDFSFNDKYFIVESNQNQVWEFTPATNTWIKKNPSTLSSRLTSLGEAFQIGNKIFMFDGDQIVIYNPISDTWETGAEYSTNLLSDEYTTGVIKDKLYMISPLSSGAQTIYSAYDPVLDNWTILETIDDRSHETLNFLFSIGNKAYLYNTNYSLIPLPYSLSNFWSYTPE